MKCLLAFLIAIPMLSSCVNPDVRTAPGVVDLTSASNFIIGQKDKGVLPGINKSAHCSMQSRPIELSQAERAEGLTSINFRVTADDKADVVFWYDVTKSSLDSQWKLTAARQTDESGGHEVNLLAK